VDHAQIIYVSPAYEQIWGRSCENLYEQPSSWLEAIHPEDRDRVEAALKGQIQGDYDVEYRIVQPDNSIRWIRDRGFPVQDAQGQVYRLAGIAEDITSRKQVEEELYNTLQKERELRELKSRFVSMTSHEFRTPLTTIQSSADLLERYRQRFSEEKQLTHLYRIQTAVERMIQMLNDILILGQAEAGKLEFDPTSVDLVQFCRNLVEDLQLAANSKNAVSESMLEERIRFTCQCQSLPASFDEKLLRHILNNLLSNAIKYSPSGSTVQFNLTYVNDNAVFQIQDQGIGIPPEDQPRLFNSFHRAKNVGTIQGTGLGLAIVKQCVDLHGGEITVTSQIGKGTTFTVTLPLNTQM
jgi:PAS domain S-box-containing protein